MEVLSLVFQTKSSAGFATDVTYVSLEEIEISFDPAFSAWFRITVYPATHRTKTTMLMGMGDFWVCRAFTPTTSAIAESTAESTCSASAAASSNSNTVGELARFRSFVFSRSTENWRVHGLGV